MKLHSRTRGLEFHRDRDHVSRGPLSSSRTRACKSAFNEQFAIASDFAERKWVRNHNHIIIRSIPEEMVGARNSSINFGQSRQRRSSHLLSSTSCRFASVELFTITNRPMRLYLAV